MQYVYTQRHTLTHKKKELKLKLIFQAKDKINHHFRDLDSKATLENNGPIFRIIIIDITMK